MVVICACNQPILMAELALPKSTKRQAKRAREHA
jgi:hypothetical protein